MLGFMQRVLVIAAFAAIVAVSREGALGSAQGGASFRTDPPTQDVASGTFEVNIVQTTPFSPTGAQASVQFDPTLLKIVNVEPGPGYASATFVVGVAPQTTQEAIAEANSTGELK